MQTSSTWKWNTAHTSTCSLQSHIRKPGDHWGHLSTNTVQYYYIMSSALKYPQKYAIYLEREIAPENEGKDL